MSSRFLDGSADDGLTNPGCICATDPDCQQPLPFYEYHWFYSNIYVVPAYTAPGLVLGCSTVDSLLSSTLECFYSDSDCFSMLLYYTSFSIQLYVGESESRSEQLLLDSSENMFLVIIDIIMLY